MRCSIRNQGGRVPSSAETWRRRALPAARLSLLLFVFLGDPLLLAFASLAQADEARTIYSFPLDVDPGWTREGEWEFGKPTGMGEPYYGHRDPTNAATGINVFG